MLILGNSKSNHLGEQGTFNLRVNPNAHVPRAVLPWVPGHNTGKGEHVLRVWPLSVQWVLTYLSADSGPASSFRGEHRPFEWGSRAVGLCSPCLR